MVLPGTQRGLNLRVGGRSNSSGPGHLLYTVMDMFCVYSPRPSQRAYEVQITVRGILGHSCFAALMVRKAKVSKTAGAVM